MFNDAQKSNKLNSYQEAVTGGKSVHVPYGYLLGTRVY